MNGAAVMDPVTGAIGGGFSEAGTYTAARPEVRAEDLALVAALQAGSDDAFRQLISQYSGPLYSLLLRSLADPADAADVTQDVFIKVFRSIGGFHGDSSLRTWIYRIAMHEASNSRRWWVRHKKAEITIDGDSSTDEDGELTFSLRDTLADGRDSPFENARQAQLRTTVEAALRDVPESFRTVVILREVEGMAYDEIAEILNINIGTVKSRLMRGRAALRTLLGARLPEFARPVHKKAPQSAARATAATSKEAR
ncbi:sigma-70 family RNA polymerase sigma factor [Terriglobus roseus]|uniref:RNA polymerase sigma-70 factor, ECF subfamily n=1 Tax=Terriglobus roseus TaxID=392734 RepID=A0A1H4M4E3_9BACT|nr:sigma-70 family RNA polymerase sigma factor [Terriglobus roseus]SEB77604.1 RNA polymerase sigma-70 factor, ECF subfamily [Terriglobus roseus]